ncbi:hypothetical protein PG984_008143 [Apiospora sp. TS-2023a]
MKQFAMPQEHFKGIPSANSHGDVAPIDSFQEGSRGNGECVRADNDFLEIVKNVAAVFTLKPEHIPGRAVGEVHETSVEIDPANRVCLPLTLPSRLSKDRLVVVGGVPGGDMSPIIDAAYALGIRVTLVDFIEPPRISGEIGAAVESYIHIPAPTQGVPFLPIAERIVASISSSGPFDGIVTFDEGMQGFTAIAARELGLRSMSPNLVQRLIDKQMTRRFCSDPVDTVRVDTPAYDPDALERLKGHLETPGLLPKYPLILKPCPSSFDVGYRLATNSGELVRAIAAWSMTMGPGISMLIDHYEDGPEFQANLVLQDGELLFSEIVDSFPTTGDQCLLNNKKNEYFNLPDGDFLQTKLAWSSKLPRKEQGLVSDAVYNILLAEGVRDGVFHATVRVRNSSVHYAPVPSEDVENDEDGDESSLIDLMPRFPPPDEEPTAIVQEIRPQPPGIEGYCGGQMTHGIDYYALYMLDALGERERFRALCRPFNFFSDSGPVPLWIACAYLNVPAGQINYNGDLGALMQKVRPELMEHIWCGTFDWRQMDRPWELRVGTFVVVSTESRRKALEIADELKEVTKIETRLFSPRPAFTGLWEGTN